MLNPNTKSIISINLYLQPPSKHPIQSSKMVRQDQDPHQGGSLSDFAVAGTTIPNDAGKMNTIPSVPRPDQRAEHPAYQNSGIAQPSTAFAADNATDLPVQTVMWDRRVKS
jgi:hypothetical protein